MAIVIAGSSSRCWWLLSACLIWLSLYWNSWHAPVAWVQTGFCRKKLIWTICRSLSYGLTSGLGCMMISKLHVQIQGPLLPSCCQESQYYLWLQGRYTDMCALCTLTLTVLALTLIQQDRGICRILEAQRPGVVANPSE